MDPTTLMLMLGLGGSASSILSGGSSSSSSSSLLSMFTAGSGAPTGSGGAGGNSMLAGMLKSVGALFGLASGPGRGKQRKDAVRAWVQKQPALMALRQQVAQSVPMGKAPSSQLAALVRSSPALKPLIAKAVSYGGFGIAQGPDANALGDVFKYVLGGEMNNPKRYVPSLQELIGWSGGGQASAPAAIGAPASISRVAYAPSYGSYWAGHAYSPGY